MKIIALDFDGVIVVNGRISPAAIKNLNKLLDEVPELEIVISSSWRHSGLKFCKDLLKLNGVDDSRIVGMTDSTHRDDRGHHVERFIKDHNPESFVILDDNNDMDKVLDHLVQTNPMVGLTSSDVKKAVAILNK